MKNSRLFNILRELYGNLCMKRYLSKNVALEEKYLHLFNGAIDTENDGAKLEYRIRICVHGIEKGFSYRDIRPAFGKDKILYLLGLLSKYNELEGANLDFTKDCLSTVKYYIDSFDSQKQITPIKDVYNNLINKLCVEIEPKNASLFIAKKDIDVILSHIDYEAFMASRHSCRFFKKTPVDNALLEKAFRIAEHTPTACNRQAQKVYVFRGEQKQKLLNISPSRSFVDEIDTAILVTVDMRAYFSDEAWQCYVDGGLYAMNLLNAIHSTRLGTIPLTASVYAVTKRSELVDMFNIPLNEAPIICIGVGNREDNYHVNASYRRGYSEYVHWVK